MAEHPAVWSRLSPGVVPAPDRNPPGLFAAYLTVLDCWIVARSTGLAQMWSSLVTPSRSSSASGVAHVIERAGRVSGRSKGAPHALMGMYPPGEWTPVVADR